MHGCANIEIKGVTGLSESFTLKLSAYNDKNLNPCLFCCLLLFLFLFTKTKNEKI